MFKHAITRKPGKNFDEGLTTADLGKPEYDCIIVQHEAYVNTLRDLGLEVIVLDPLPDYPDAYFVEDVAVVAPEVAVLTNPGADTRKGEVAHIETALKQFKDIERGTGALEGGDVMCVGSHYYIGISPRTSEDGAAQLGSILEKFGHTWSMVPVVKHIHLKTSVNYLGENTLLMTPPFAELEAFKGFEKILVDEADLPVVNTLLVNGHLLTPKGFPHVKEKLLALNPNVIELDVSEVAKMDGGLSCMSLRFG